MELGWERDGTAGWRIDGMIQCRHGWYMGLGESAVLCGLEDIILSLCA